MLKQERVAANKQSSHARVFRRIPKKKIGLLGRPSRHTPREWPKLPLFGEQRDNIDNLLDQFEAIVLDNGWSKTEIVKKLRPQLTGRSKMAGHKPTQSD